MNAKPLKLKPIRTKADYRQGLKVAESFFDAAEELDPKTAEGAFFDALLTLIEAYERKHYPIDPADPIEATRFRMDQLV